MNRTVGLATSLALVLPAVAGAQSSVDSVVKVAPACPNMGTDAKTRQFVTDTITISYDPHAKTATLRKPTEMTTHMAFVGWSSNAPPHTKDLAMTAGAGGIWTTSFTLTGVDAGDGYAMVDFEDQGHRVDNNHGEYWDLALCRFGLPYREGAKANTYEGRAIAPGFQRAPNLPRALSIVREDYAKTSGFGDLFWIWTYEREIGNESPTTYQRVSREMSEQLDKWGTYSAMLSQISGFVSFAENKLDPAVVAKYRTAILAMPNDPPMQYSPVDGKLHPVPRTKQWDEATAREMQWLLSDLDFPPIAKISDPIARAAAYEEFTKKYADCKDCRDIASAYVFAFEIYTDQHDLGSAARVEREWAYWDPKNPDPLATLADAYLKANTNLEDAQRLVEEAANLYAPFADESTFQTYFRDNIRAQMYKTAAPFPGSKAAIPLLRGKIESALGEWGAAQKDLQLACDEKTEDNSAEAALGTALEHTGDKEGALAAYLKAASAPYQTGPEPEEDFLRLFVALQKGSDQQAESALTAAVEANRRAIAAQYVPVELHREMPALELKSLSGETIRHPIQRHEATVVDFWSVWCGACVAELPSLLAFQQSHPHVSVLAVAITDKPSEVQEFLRKKHLNQLHVAVILQMPAAFPEGFPTTAVVSPAGQLAFVHEGAPADITAVLQKDLAQFSR